MRFVRGNVRDHIATPKSTTALRSGTTERFSDREVKESTFARFSAPSDFRLFRAGSTGRRNTGVKSLCRCFKLQGLTWSFVNPTSNTMLYAQAHDNTGAIAQNLFVGPEAAYSGSWTYD
jgi:hypothetical protein